MNSWEAQEVGTILDDLVKRAEVYSGRDIPQGIDPSLRRDFAEWFAKELDYRGFRIVRQDP